MDPLWNPELKPGLAELADLAALTDWNTTNATAEHETIAAELWTALHRLGVGGRMLVVGEDPEVYAGLPRAERLVSPGVTGELVGCVPGASWPHSGLHLQQPGAAPDPFDLVINNVPVNDLVIHSAQAAAQHWMWQALNALWAIGMTRPGGLTVLLASSRLLDDTESYPRREMSRLTEFLGALRLPAGTFRHAPGNDGTVDLILLHNNGAPGPVLFTASIPVTLDGRTVHINEYFDSHPEHVLGTLTSRDNPWGPADTTVVTDRADLATELRAAPTHIADAARARGLTTRSETRRRNADPRHRAPARQPPTDALLGDPGSEPESGARSGRTTARPAPSLGPGRTRSAGTAAGTRPRTRLPRALTVHATGHRPQPPRTAPS